MTLDHELYLETDYQTQVVPDVLSDGVLIFVASHPEIQGLRAHGATPEEALDSLSEGFRVYLEDTLDDGMQMPSPHAAVVNKAIWRTLLGGYSATTPPSIGTFPSARFYSPLGEANSEFATSGR